MHPRSHTNNRPAPAVLLAATALLVAPLVVGCPENVVAPTPSNTPLPPRTVFALGSIEPADGVISVTAAPGDRLKALDPDVALNKKTPANGVLGLMSSYDTRMAQLKGLQIKRELTAEKHNLDLATAQAQVVAADARLAEASAKLAEVKVQEKKLAYLEEAADIAADDLAELRRLAAADDELVSDRQLRRQANRVDQAQKDFEIATELYVTGVAAAETARDAALASKQAAENSLLKLTAMNPARAVDEEIKLAKQALAQTVLITPDKSPTDIDATQVKLASGDAGELGRFTVLKVFLSPGEAVTQTPVLQLGDLSSIVCVAEVYEADAKNLSPGQPATISSEAFSDKFDEGIRGKIESISRMVASPGLNPRNPLAPVDRSVVAVRVAIDPKNPNAIEEAGKWIGMQVQVEFEKPAGGEGDAS